MPKYIYECTSCEHVFEIRHSIKDKFYDCQQCDEKNTLHRIPSLPTIINKSKATGDKPGALVKRFIEEAKSEIKSEKKSLGDREYEG